MSLVIISTHPIQYHAPIYRYLKSALGVEVTVIYGTDQGVTRYRDKDFGVSFSWDTDLLSGYRAVFLNRANAEAAFDPQKISAKGLRSAIDAAKPTVILILGYAFPLYQNAWIYAKKKKYPVMLRMEVNDISYKTCFLKNWIRNYILRRVYQKSEAFLYIGQVSYGHYRRLGVERNKLFFSPYAIDMSAFQVTEDTDILKRRFVRNQLNISAEATVALFSGKFIDIKHAEIILKAMRTLPPDFQKKMTVIYLGSGPLKPLIEREIRKDLKARVIFLGFKNQMELSDYYHAADFVILPSRKETWGIVVNEALSHGLPCIVSDHVGCHKDLIEPGTTGEIFKKGDKNSLAEAILRISAYCRSPSVSERCREKIKGYSVEAAAKGIEKAYHSIASHAIEKSSIK